MEQGIADGPAQVEFIHDGMASGPVAQRLLESGLSVNSMRLWKGDDGLSYMTKGKNEKAQSVRVNANTTLRKDEWKHYDTAVVKVAQERLVAVGDLQSRGLVLNIANGLGKTVLEYEDVSDFEAAELSMDGITRSQADRPEFNLKTLPLPIIHKDFYISARVLAASRASGDPLDTTMAEMASRQVAEKAEQLLLTGSSSYTFGGGTILGYTDATNRNTATLSQNWDASGKTGQEILTDVLNCKQAIINDNYGGGPYGMYIPTAYDTVLDDEFATGYTRSIRSRLMEVEGLESIKVADKLTANNVIMVTFRSDVVRLVNGLPVTTVEWGTHGNMRFHFKVMAILVPQIRNDQTNQSGICHLS